MLDEQHIKIPARYQQKMKTLFALFFLYRAGYRQQKFLVKLINLSYENMAISRPF
jgi:hypothetical protein